jgi:hypothetical protein
MTDRSMESLAEELLSGRPGSRNSSSFPKRTEGRAYSSGGLPNLYPGDEPHRSDAHCHWEVALVRYDA